MTAEQTAHPRFDLAPELAHHVRFSTVAALAAGPEV